LFSSLLPVRGGLLIKPIFDSVPSFIVFGIPIMVVVGLWINRYTIDATARGIR
jgi:hypothetical protein